MQANAKIILTLCLSIAGLVTSVELFARTCEVKITANDQLQYNESEITVAGDCNKVTLTLEHTGKLPVQQMGHNWTLTKTEDWKEIARLGQAVGLENDYLPADDKRILAHTDMIGGGETASVTFSLAELSADQDYTFFCSFPGHWAVMNGKFTIEQSASTKSTG